ncbi:MAG: hypothetical protein GX052_06705 [Syntrophomonadaceae bacterium]|nr:hypothetical protein [Syntrophomonadaceae bacterium]
MKKISPSEMLQLRELMQMEANALAMARVTHHVIQDPEFKSLSDAGIKAMETRIREMQMFINDHDLIPRGVQ